MLKQHSLDMEMMLLKQFPFQTWHHEQLTKGRTIATNIHPIKATVEQKGSCIYIILQDFLPAQSINSQKTYRFDVLLVLA